MSRYLPLTWHPHSVLVILVVFGLFATQYIALDAAQSHDTNQCASKKTCTDCLQMANKCSWCSQPNITSNTTRCFPSASTAFQLCQSVVNPQNELLVTQDLSLTMKESKTNTTDKVVQIRPQRVNLTMRVNQSFKLDVQFSRAMDYPIDLYYLMDLSKSMEDDKDKLVFLSGELISTMQSLTTDFQLGFGGFIDKTVLPFGSNDYYNITSATFPFSFRNMMSLSKDVDKFSRKVKDSQTIGNVDTPEGGFDGIMQAIVCQKVINWRSEARRLLLYTSDEDFHTAGDGKLGGIIARNDGECHLDYDGFYEYFAEQDYPSISHINAVAKQHSVNIIFAVTANAGAVYQNLTKLVAGSSFAVLNNDSSNVVQLVKDEYDVGSTTYKQSQLSCQIDQR